MAKCSMCSRDATQAVAWGDGFNPVCSNCAYMLAPGNSVTLAEAERRMSCRQAGVPEFDVKSMKDE